MTPDNIRTVLALLGIEVPGYQPRTGWIISHCPLGPWRHEGGQSSEGRFGVKVETGDPRANCFSCGWRGHLTDLALQMRYLNKQHPVGQFEWPTVLQLIAYAEDDFELDLSGPTIDEIVLAGNDDYVFPDWWLESFLPWYSDQDAQQYLAARQAPPSVLDALDVRWDSNQRRICFQVRDFTDRLRGLHGRAIHPKTQPRYRMYQQAGQTNPIVWMGEDWVDITRPIIVVEGPFDLVSVMRIYRNVVSPLFATPSFAKLRRMGGALEWITLYDRGTGGNSGRDRVDAALSKDHLITHLLPPEHCKDPGEMTYAELLDLLSPHIEPDDLLLD